MAARQSRRMLSGERGLRVGRYPPRRKDNCIWQAAAGQDGPRSAVRADTMSDKGYRALRHSDTGAPVISLENDTVSHRSNWLPRPAGPHAGRPVPSQQYLADFSLALINRTGAYFVSRDLLHHLPDHFAATRYWRLLRKSEPQGLVRWLLGKAMLMELALGLESGRRRPSEFAGRTVPTLFLDPLYVLHSELKRGDIVLCHDIGPISHPALFDTGAAQDYKRAYNRIVEARPGIVFVSETSRQTFVTFFGADFRFLKVIPLYVRHGIELGNDTPPPGVRKPFLLTVGALEARKNYPRIFEAFEQSGLAGDGYSYVFCGPRGNAADEVGQLAKAVPSVHALGYRTDAELRWLYRNASGLVLPSLLEGFGLPSLEAARHRLLSMVSAGTALEEAVGDGAVLVDPLSVKSIAAGMRLLVEMNESEREEKLTLAMHRAQELSLGTYIRRWTDLLDAN
jgi:glycosyltransferase involved in cell wall biosynthesis